MSAITPMEARCKVCGDTGSMSCWAGGNLDCTACGVAEERVRLNRAIEDEKNKLTQEYRLSTFSAEWFAYQLGKASAAPVAAQPSEAVPQNLRDIGQQLRTQDDDYTADAMYVVERKRILTGLDTDYSQGPEDIVWCIEDSMIFQGDAEFDALERGYEDHGIIPQDYTRTGFSVSWDLVTVFFTRADAEKFIEHHGHKYGGALRFTIECEVRNEQWRAIREWLMSLDSDPTAAVSAAPSGEAIQIAHDMAIAAAERWVAAEFKNAKNLGAGGPGLASECDDMERAARRAIAKLAAITATKE